MHNTAATTQSFSIFIALPFKKLFSKKQTKKQTQFLHLDLDVVWQMRLIAILEFVNEKTVFKATFENSNYDLEMY